MNWNQALIQISAIIKPSLKLDLNCQFKIVVATPNFYISRRKSFLNMPAYRIQIGKRNFIDVPLNMLMNIHNWSQFQAANQYNKIVFNFLYPNLLNNFPTYFHSVGKIYEIAGVAFYSRRFNQYIII